MDGRATSLVFLVDVEAEFVSEQVDGGWTVALSGHVQHAQLVLV